MNKQNDTARFTWMSFGLWVIMTIIGYIPGADLHYATSAQVIPFRLRDVMLFSAFMGFLFGAVSGLIIAVLQWMVLKQSAPQARLWIPLNMLGFGLIHAVNDSVTYLPLPFPMLLGVGGLIVGLCQFAALQKVLSRAIWWVPLLAATWVCAFLLGQALLVFVPGNPLGELILGNGSKGIVVGVITGLALKALRSNWVSRAGIHADIVKTG